MVRGAGREGREGDGWEGDTYVCRRRGEKERGVEKTA